MRFKKFISFMLLNGFFNAVAFAEDYEQFAKQQLQKSQAIMAPYLSDAQQLKANVEQRMAAGDLKTLAKLLQTPQQPNNERRYPNILVFVSFSMPKESLKAWLGEVNKAQGSLVIRGLIHNSFKETADVLVPFFKEQPGGMLLDPTLFKRFNINKVPAVVVKTDCANEQTCSDSYAIAYGNTSLAYALQKIANSTSSVAPLAQQALGKLHEH